jgi:hypothetical protein
MSCRALARGSFHWMPVVAGIGEEPAFATRMSTNEGRPSHIA